MSAKKFILIFVALIVLVVAFLLALPLLRKNKTPSLPTPTPTAEERIEEKFPGLKIPEDGQKTELKNVSGGEGIGIATKSEIFADLPDLAKGESYQVLLGNGTKTVLLGSLRKAKGGYLLQYDSSKYPGYNQIIIVQGTKHILEGSF